MSRVLQTIQAQYEQAMNMLKQFLKKVKTNIKALKRSYEEIRGFYVKKIKKQPKGLQERTLKEYQKIMEATSNDFRRYEQSVYAQPIKPTRPADIAENSLQDKDEAPLTTSYHNLQSSDEEKSPIKKKQKLNEKFNRESSISPSVSRSSKSCFSSKNVLESKQQLFPKNAQKTNSQIIQFPKPAQPSFKILDDLKKPNDQLQLQKQYDDMIFKAKNSLQKDIIESKPNQEFSFDENDSSLEELSNLPTSVVQINELALQSSKICPICQKRFSSYTQFHQHNLEKHKPYFKTETKVANQKVAYTCRFQQCGERFEGMFRNYRMHLHAVHGIDKWFCCLECSYKADEVIVFALHLLQVHGRKINVKLTIFKCPVTGKEFQVEKLLQVHVAETYEYHFQQPDGHFNPDPDF